MATTTMAGNMIASCRDGGLESGFQRLRMSISLATSTTGSAQSYASSATVRAYGAFFYLMLCMESV